MKKIKPLLFAFFILLFTNCEKEEYSNSEETKMTSSTISKNQLINELKNNDIIDFVLKSKYLNSSIQHYRGSEENEAFEKIVKPNDFITYSLKLNNYSSSTPFFKYFIINKDENGEKAGFVKYIPSTPLFKLDVDNFTGDIEIYSTDNELFAKTSFQNGQVSTNNKNNTSNRTCVNVSYLVGMPCSHGGNHMPGQSCQEGFTNDAYYIVMTTVVCVNPPKTITAPDEFAGSSGGGGAGPTILAALNIPPTYEGEPNLNNPSFLYFYEVLTFLQNNTAYTNVINHNYASAYLLNEWLVPSITNYFRINGFNQQNQINVINALNNFIQFVPLDSNQYNFEQILFNKNNVLQLLIENANWLSNQPNEVKQNIINYLIQKDLSPEAVASVNELINNVQSNTITLSFANELINLAIAEPNQTDVNNIINFVLQTKIQDKFYNDIDENFLLSVDQYMDLDVAHIDPIIMAQLKMYFTIQCAIKRHILSQDPEWNNKHPLIQDLIVDWEASKEMIHITLDIFGTVPVFGEPADLINGVLYTIEGDGVNATLSFAGAVPVAGWAAIGIKYANKVVNSSQVAYSVATRVRLTWKVLENGSIYFGANSTCRDQLRKVLGLLPGNLNKAHHIIPLNLQTNSVIQKAAKSGSAFHLNEALNGIPLNSLVHNGSHGAYDSKIFQKLKAFADANPNATPDQCYNKVVNVINEIRTAIQNNPNTPINQLIF